MKESLLALEIVEIEIDICSWSSVLKIF